MNQRRVSGFTIIELFVVIIIIAILAAVVVTTYNGITKAAATSTTKAHLYTIATEMQRGLRESSIFPNTLPANLTTNSNVTAQIKFVGSIPVYSNLTAVQNGTLLSTICQYLIDTGVGKAQNQAGEIQDYITGCGNWNYNRMQVTGWDTRRWDTPVTVQQLRNYGNTFTTRDAYNKAGHESAIKKFYNTMADTFLRQGGVSPITSFWDYWADPGNGGVMYQPLPTSTPRYHYYCAEAQSIRKMNIIWNVTETNVITSGPC
jgi:type II secretory pathway pseudopilin PulG